MPKLIDYPRTSYAGAWEVADVVDDTGGKCALDTCARKLNRKVSGSFKAIIGSAVKFGLLTSKRELLTTTTLFRRIKHAYDKQEELLFHREAFLTPPLFTQLCRKFRSRELPVQMLDIMLIREFDVEEINAQGVAKAFIDGARMVGLLDERNTIADIDQLAAQQPSRRELASPELSPNSFRAEVARSNAAASSSGPENNSITSSKTDAIPPRSTSAIAEMAPEERHSGNSAASSMPLKGSDAVASLFGLADSPAVSNQSGQSETEAASRGYSTLGTDSAANDRQPAAPVAPARSPRPQSSNSIPAPTTALPHSSRPVASPVPPEQPVSQSAATSGGAAAGTPAPRALEPTRGFRIELSGPGLNTVLDVNDEDDLALARFLLDKIGRQLSK